MESPENFNKNLEKIEKDNKEEIEEITSQDIELGQILSAEEILKNKENLDKLINKSPLVNPNANKEDKGELEEKVADLRDKLKKIMDGGEKVE